MKSKLVCIKLSALMAAVCTALPTVSTGASIPVPHEYWVSTNTTGANLGTQHDPYDGSTQARFDNVMTGIRPNSTVHILAGRYETAGGARIGIVKNGQKIVGSGMDVTTIQLIASVVNGSFTMQNVNGSYVTNCEVSDMTLDCNYASATNPGYTRCGLRLFGTRNAIRRVKVIHAAHPVGGSDSEAWGIVLGGNSLGNDSDGNIIEGCEVSQFAGGDGISAISFNGSMSGIMRNNRVLLSPTNNYFAFNGSGMHEVIIESNYVNGASAGYYGDTGDTTNLVLSHNTFKNCVFGIYLWNPNHAVTSRQNLTFAYNTILLATNFSYAEQAINISGVRCTNLTIIGNTVGWNGSPGPAGVGYFLDLRGVQGLVVAHNRVDPTLTTAFGVSDSTNSYVIYDNHDLAGKLLTNKLTPRVARTNRSSSNVRP